MKFSRIEDTFTVVCDSEQDVAAVWAVLVGSDATELKDLTAPGVNTDLGASLGDLTAYNAARAVLLTERQALRDQFDECDALCRTGDRSQVWRWARLKDDLATINQRLRDTARPE